MYLVTLHNHNNQPNLSQLSLKYWTHKTSRFLDKTLREFTEKDCSDFRSTFCVQHRSLIHQAIGSELLSGSLIGHKYPVIVVVIAGVRLCYDYYVRLKQRKRLFFPRLFSHIVFTVFYSAEHFTAPH